MIRSMFRRVARGVFSTAAISQRFTPTTSYRGNFRLLEALCTAEALWHETGSQNQMGKKKVKFYAVKRGYTPGIYESWEDCKVQVNGFKGNEYKSFPTKAEAEAFIGKDLRKSGKSSPEKKTPKRLTAVQTGRRKATETTTNGSTVVVSDSEPAAKRLRLSGKGTKVEDKEQPKGSLVGYTDGACSMNSNVSHVKHPAGWGFVVLKVCSSQTLKVVHESAGPVVIDKSNEAFIGAEVTSNNTAELSAIGHFFKYVLTLDGSDSVKKIVVRYDSKYAADAVQGLHKKVRKNHALIKNVREIMDQVKGKGITIQFLHVKGHSGDRWNDRADLLARKGCGM
mmetsp:Transcript_7753/g.8895  ORF Transcript_7753/g.8895 Transcript_7753/m.8895 type:complete len:338 (+) Transcript_7753:3-1016(+)